MNYKGFRIDRKFNIYDLNDNLIVSKVGNIVIAKEYIDDYLEKKHKGILTQDVLTSAEENQDR